MPSVNGVRRGIGVRQQPALPRILTVKVNNIIGLDKYYRSATLLLRQVCCVLQRYKFSVPLARTNCNVPSNNWLTLDTVLG